MTLVPLEMESALGVNSCVIKAGASYFDALSLQGWMAYVPPEESKWPNEFALEIFVVGIQLIPNPGPDENRPISHVFAS
jgi:hypothetical protein